MILSGPKVAAMRFLDTRLGPLHIDLAGLAEIG